MASVSYGNPDLAVSATFGTMGAAAEQQIAAQAIQAQANLTEQGRANIQTFIDWQTQEKQNQRKRDLASVKSSLDFNLAAVEDIGYLGTVNELQYASKHMQNWIMQSPYLVNLANENVISGYVETREEPLPEITHGTTAAYRYVTDGVFMPVHDTNGDVNHKAVHYYSDEDLSGYTLTKQQKINVMRTWQFMEEYIRDELGDIDPTSMWDDIINS